MSTKSKRVNKKTATKVTVNSSSSPFSQFLRIVGPGGVTIPTPASALTIPQVFQEQQQQQAVMEHAAEWHTETRQKIIAAIAQLPGSPSVQILTGLTSIKLAAQALMLFTTQNPHGNFKLLGTLSISNSYCWSCICPLPLSISLTLSIVASTIKWSGSSPNGLHKP